MAVWAGVDVGARRKGFHVAVLDEQRVVHGPSNATSVADTIDLLERLAPLVIGIDSPCRPAPPGARSRACERELARAVCGLRYTPDAKAIGAGGSYYEWIRNGLALYKALGGAGGSHRPCKPAATRSSADAYDARVRSVGIRVSRRVVCLSAPKR